MRTPHEMRLVGLTRQEYQIIGKIAVLSGMLEQQMKETLVKMASAPWPGGLAIFAHMNFRSLCDVGLALIPSTIPDTGERFSLQKAFHGTFTDADKVYDSRNKILHGPFSPWPAITGSKKTTLKITARRKIQYSAFIYDQKALNEVLDQFIDVFESLAGCIDLLERARDGSELFPPPPRRRKAGAKSNPQKHS